MGKKEENFVREFKKLFRRKINVRSFRLSLQISNLVENEILKYCNKIGLKGTLMATGSFARRELSFYSDVHLLWLLPPEKDIKTNREDFESYFKELGISVDLMPVAIEELESLKNNITVFTKFFEARFICGRKNLFKKFVKRLFFLLEKENKKEFIEKYLDDIQKRYERYGDSPKILEPNVKYTAGGLRDLQSVEWMYSIKNNLILSEELESTQTEKFIQLLRSEKTISGREASALLAAYAFELNLRNLLHRINGRKTDRLSFENQRKLAAELGYPAKEWMRLTKLYFKHANYLHGFSKTMIKKFKEEIYPPLSDHLLIRLDDKFYMKGSRILVNNNSYLTISAMLRAFYYRGFHNAKFDKNLRALIVNSVQRLENKELREHDSAIFFREILKLPQNVGNTLRAMNELNVLGLLLTEFKDVVGFFTPEVIHDYTTDEHTLIAIKNLEALAKEENELGRLFNLTERKDLLYLALLLHEIGKPISVEGHEIIGSEFAFPICSRLGYSYADTEVVSFLIRNYLKMEETAFNENIYDRQVIENFSDIFPSLKHLNLLYLLTYASLSARSSFVLTHWKRALLNKLFLFTKDALEEKFSKESSLYPLDFEESSSDGNKETPFEDEFVNNREYEFLIKIKNPKISEAIRNLKEHNRVSVLFTDDGSFTNVIIVAKNKDFLLSGICGSLTINEADIRSANIHTTKDNIVLQSFNVVDYKSRKPLDKSKYEKIRNDIFLAIDFNLDISQKFKSLRSKWVIWRNRLLRRGERIAINFSERKYFTVLKIQSPDMIGLLYTITVALGELNLKVYFGSIEEQKATIVSEFFVLDEENKKIAPENFELIKLTLKEKIKEILER